jgi:hypothetical protein
MRTIEKGGEVKREERSRGRGQTGEGEWRGRREVKTVHQITLFLGHIPSQQEVDSQFHIHEQIG